MREPRRRDVVRILAIIWLWAFILSPPAVMAQDGLDRSDEIVFIDRNGFIRVIDPHQTANTPAVQWRSPAGGWHDAALGDVNGDGDAEIVAIGRGAGNEDGDTMRLTIFDPVVTTGPVDPAQRINGIPWATLFTTELAGDPLDVVVGQFSVVQNPSPRRASIVVGAILPDRAGDEETPSRITLLDPTSADGRNWTVRFTRDFSVEWSLIRAGDLDNRGVDEVLLVDDSSSVLAVYRVANEMSDAEDRIYVNGSESKKWNDAVVMLQGDRRLAAVRGTPNPLPSFLIQHYPGAGAEEWQDVCGRFFNPEPRRVFTADTNGDGNDELLLLRAVPADQTGFNHLFLRHGDCGDIPRFEVRLDQDNGYREGVGGDIYGNDDGRDEVVVMRDNNIRVFTQPELDQQRADFGRSTNQRTLLAGDLDAAGYVARARLTTEPGTLTQEIEQGERRGPFAVILDNVGSDQPIRFDYHVSGDPVWIDVRVDQMMTPARFEVTFDAHVLLPGEYVTAINVTTAYTDILDSELTTPITLTVAPAITAIPDRVDFVYYPCADSLAPRSQELLVAGRIGHDFAVRLAPSMDEPGPVPWVSAAPTGGSLPSTVTLTVDPARRASDWERAVLILNDLESTGVEQIVPVSLFCVRQRSYLPLVTND